jgi:hypothetical protein
MDSPYVVRVHDFEEAGDKLVLGLEYALGILMFELLTGQNDKSLRLVFLDVGVET